MKYFFIFISFRGIKPFQEYKILLFLYDQHFEYHECSWPGDSRNQGSSRHYTDNDHSGYGLGQWEEALLCNAFSHWPSPYPEWSLYWPATVFALAEIFLAATKQLYEWYFLSVRLSVCLSVCHTFLTMFPSSYHHKISRSYHQGPG